ncbi:16S rRNA (uracil(1498)-N(3))-methyltransferase [Moorena producens]|uniref:16S rRNA (uracil(1498)-N(3))-methyltransferase n=1 Tax=Moorena producens TaxID=1155739 RepID=UPI003C78C556
MQRLVISPAQCQDQGIVLTDAQQHYLIRVLRLRKGDRFIAMDGEGSWYVSELEGDLTQAKIVASEHIQTELPKQVTLMAAMPKGSGFEQICLMATELGVTRIVPLKSDRTLLNPSPQKLQRWRRITQEAAEQSEREVVPKILDPVDFSDSLQLPETLEAYRYICVARGKAPHLLNCLLDLRLGLDTRQTDPAQHPGIVIATGPEGGWTTQELEQATAAGFIAVSLGSRILRAITAPIVTLSIVAAVAESSVKAKGDNFALTYDNMIDN